MSVENLRGVRTLVRLRAFQESLAERDRLQAAANERAAREVADAARTAAESVSERRYALIGDGALDLGLLDAMSDFEERAWEKAHADADGLRDAERAHRDTRSRHLDARARSRVADTRHTALAAAEQDREDKRGYDRMASLLVAAASAAVEDEPPSNQEPTA